MKILNVGALEILFIVLLALIILGPKNAVKALGDVGAWLRKVKDSQIWKDFVSTSKEIQEFPKKMMDDTEVKKTLEEINKSARYSHVLKERDVKNEDVVIGDEQHHIYPDSLDNKKE